MVDQVSDVHRWEGRQLPGTTLDLWVTTLQDMGSCDADPVMHVEDVALGLWLATNDDCPAGHPDAAAMGPTSPCLTLGPPGHARDLRVWVHAKTTCAAAAGIFRASTSGHTNTLHANHSAMFGGQVLRSTELPSLGWAPGEVLTATRMLGTGPLNLLVLGLPIQLPPNVIHWDSLALLGSSVPGPRAAPHVAPEHSSLGYNEVFVVIGTHGEWLTEARARLVINDVELSDADSDGLGDGLEQQLGTCAQAGCPSALDDHPMDTDGDGLLDGWEVLGYDHPPGDDGEEVVELPMLGADPMHKDVYVEVDWNPAAGGRPIQLDEVTAVVDFYKALPSAAHANPDGEPGIRLHLDTGGPPAPIPTDFGDWGGASVVSSTSHTDSFALDMLPERQAFFRHVLIADGVPAGQAALRAIRSAVAPTGTSYSLDNFLNRFVHELGHSLGLRHWGDPAFPPLNCKPNYPSIMNYAYGGPRELSEGLLPPLISTALDEAAGLSAVDQTAAALALAGRDFALDPVTLAVDWNRNGVFDSGLVDGETRWSPGDSCDATTIHQKKLVLSAGTPAPKLSGPPALAVTDEAGAPRFHVFHVDSTAADPSLWYTTYTGRFDPCGDPPEPGCCSRDDLSADCGPTLPEPVVVTGVSGPLSSPPSAASAPSAGAAAILAYSVGWGQDRTLQIRAVSGMGIGAEMAVPDLRMAPVTDLDPRNRTAVLFEGGAMRLLYLGAANTLRSALLVPSVPGAAPSPSGCVTVAGVSDCGQDVVNAVTGAVVTADGGLVAASRLGAGQPARVVTLAVIPDSDPSPDVDDSHGRPTFWDVDMGATPCATDADCGALGARCVTTPAGAQCYSAALTHRAFYVSRVGYDSGQPALATNASRWEFWYETNSARTRRLFTVNSLDDTPSFAGNAYGVKDPPHSSPAIAFAAGRLHVVELAPDGLRHLPFADVVYPVEEEDSDDVATIARCLCTRTLEAPLNMACGALDEACRWDATGAADWCDE